MSKGSKIREFRERVHLSQVELAERIGVSKQTMYKYENDIITNIPSDKIEAIANATGVKPEMIMGWDTYVEKEEIHLILTRDEYCVIGKYRSADPSTQAIVRKILDVKDPESASVITMKPNREPATDYLAPVAAHAQEGRHRESGPDTIGEKRQKCVWPYIRHPCPVYA